MGSNYTSMTQTGVLSSDITFNGNLDLGSYNLTTTGSLTSSNLKDLIFIRYGYTGFESYILNPITTETAFTGDGSGYHEITSWVQTTATNSFFEDDSNLNYIHNMFIIAKENMSTNPLLYTTKEDGAIGTSLIENDVGGSDYIQINGTSYANYFANWINGKTSSYNDTIKMRAEDTSTGNFHIQSLTIAIHKTFLNPMTLSNYSDYISDIIGITLHDNGDIIKIGSEYYAGSSVTPITMTTKDFNITTFQVISGNPLLICKGV